MDLGIDGKVALVTAASKGLGFSTAKALVDEGCKVTICARGEEALRDAEGALGEQVLAVRADVTDPDAPRRLVEATLERFGGLHIVVPNAGGPPPGGALEVADEQISGAVEANLLTSVRLVREAVPHLRTRGWGRICCITSVSVKQPVPALALSNTARAGLWAWAKTAARDLFGDGITLNLACPGTHATERIRQLGGASSGAAGGRGALGDPDDFGKVVAFLCSEPAKFVTGAALQVDGGAVQGLL